MQTCPTCGTSSSARAKFCQECGEPFAAPAEARRRLVTALFCDLVGSTELGERLDAEVLRKLLHRYYGAMRTAIEHHGGTVEKFIGDAVVGVFGVPVAHEDDPLRAVRAALEMREAADELDAEIVDPDVRTRVKIAINTGEAFAEADAGREGRIAGDVFNTAARLQAMAGPGDVLVSGSVERMLRGSVELANLDPAALKGKAEPVEVHRVLALRPTQARTESPMVGRDRALSALLRGLDDAIEAQACVLVTVLGAPGVGKSRLADAFADTVRDRTTVLLGQTPSYGDGVTFAPLVELLAGAAGTTSGEAEAVAAALRERLADDPDNASVGDRLAQFLGVGDAIATDTSWAVRRLFEVLASERPLVIVLEDVHWAEAPMLDLVDAVVERLHGPALVLCLARPELLESRPTWAAGKLRAITTTLPPLAPEDARGLAEILLGEGVPHSVVDRVCETAEGNPLYLEQLIAMLSDQGLLAGGRWLGADIANIEIPATLQALLTARLDRLDQMPRLILERASVEGRRFRVTGLLALAPNLSRTDVEEAIAGLDRRGMIQPEDEAGGRWRFAHALVLESAYRGLSKELRADLHERLADWMLEEDADQPEVDESVARHLERALHLREELGMSDDRSIALSTRAGELFAAAGSRAFAALDLITARDLLGRGALLLPDTSPTRLDILPNLGVALTETGRPAETEALLGTAIGQARTAGSDREALRATIQLLSNRIYRSPTDAEIASSVEEAEEAMSQLEALGDDVGIAEAAVALEYLEWVRGRIASAHEWCFRALSHALTAGRTREAAQASADIVNHLTAGPVPFDRLAEMAEERLFPEDEPISICTGRALLALSALGGGDEAGFHEHESRWQAVVDRHGLAWLAAAHALVIGGVQSRVGDAEAAERRLRDARDVLAALGDIWWITTLDSSLCEAIRAQGRRREFLALADTLVETPGPVPDRQFLIRRDLVRAQANLMRGSASDAEIAIRRAIELAAPTDLLPDRAYAFLTLAAVLDARDLREEATESRAEAASLLRAKGATAAIARLGA